MTVQNLPTPDSIKRLIDPLAKTENKSGMQRAHIVGDKFAERLRLGFFNLLLGKSGKNDNSNGMLASQAQRRGAILGVAVHGALDSRAVERS